jgi:hypothetical protein
MATVRKFEDLDVWKKSRNLVNLGSCGELRCQIIIAYDLNYIEEDQFKELSNLAEEISKSLKGLIRYLQNSDYKGIKNKK